MGILDEVMGSIAGNAGGGSPIQGALMGLLGGHQAGGQPAPGAAAGGIGGGLGALLQRFEGAGLGSVAQSWIGNGPNQSITPQQLHGVLGDEQVQTLSSQSGIPSHDLLSQLSQHLPGIIDRLIPGGRLPGAGTYTSPPNH